MWQTIWIAFMSAWITAVVLIGIYKSAGNLLIKPFTIVGINTGITILVCIFGKFFDTHGVSPLRTYIAAAIEPLALAFIFIGIRFFHARLR